MRSLVILGGMVVLVACQSVPPGETGPESCGAGALQGLIGQSAEVLETMKFAAPTRILRPGMAVTMDFSPDRLNIEIDGAERIVRVQCG